MARDRREYSRQRRAELKAAGVPSDVARGHPKPGQRSLSEARQAAKQRGHTVRQVYETDAALGLSAAKSSRVVKGARNDAGMAGRILDTRSKRDANKFTRDAERDGDRMIQLIGTKADGTGVPLYGAGIGTTAGNQPRPQHGGDASGGSQGTGNYGAIRASEWNRLVADQYGGELWDAIDGEGENYGWSSAAVVAVHIFVL